MADLIKSNLRNEILRNEMLRNEILRNEMLRNIINQDNEDLYFRINRNEKIISRKKY